MMAMSVGHLSRGSSPSRLLLKWESQGDLNGGGGVRNEQ